MAQWHNAYLATHVTTPALGLDVSLIELGNEFYLNKPDYVAAFANGHAYGSVCKTWVAAIRAEWPTARVAVVTTPSTAGSTGRVGTWNAGLFAALGAPAGSVDATMHEYTPSGVDCGGCRLSATDVNTLLIDTPTLTAAKMAAAVAALPAAVRRCWAGWRFTDAANFFTLRCPLTVYTTAFG